MKKIKSKKSDWSPRIKASRSRRENKADDWRSYCRHYRQAELLRKASNDVDSTELPDGDRVKLALIYRNMEQTLAMMEGSDYVVDATLMQHDREQDSVDTHREKVVESSLINSLHQSGMLSNQDIADRVKHDGLIIGHGITYSYYRAETEKVEEKIPVMKVNPTTQTLEYDYDENGRVKQHTEKTDQVVYEAVQDEHVSPFEFLFDSSAKFLEDAAWHGREKIVSLDTLKKDKRLKLPTGLVGSKLPMMDYYDQSPRQDWDYGDDMVKRIDVYDIRNRQLITFVEACIDSKAAAKTKAPGGDSVVGKNRTTEPEEKKKKGFFSRAATAVKSIAKENSDSLSDKDIHLVRVVDLPIRFDNPDRSLFNFFVPIPANGDPFGVSQIEHIILPSEEADKTQTRIVNHLREWKRIFLVKKGRVDSDQIDQIFKVKDKHVIEVEAREDGDNLNSLIQEHSSPSLGRELYAAPEAATASVRNISGVTDIPLSGADTATEAEGLMAVGGARINRKRARFLMYLTSLVYAHKALKAEFSPEQQFVEVENDVGGRSSLEFGRDVFQHRFLLKVLPFNEAAGRSPVQRKLLIDMSSAHIGRWGPKFDRLMMREIFRELDIRSANRLVEAIPLQPQLPPGAPQDASQLPQESIENVTDAQTLRGAINVAHE